MPSSQVGTGLPAPAEASDRAADEGADGPPGPVRRAWALPLWCHALCLAGLLVALAPFLGLDDTFVIDEGAYAIQVRSLDEGSWEYTYAAQTFDEEGRWMPLSKSTQSERGWFPYVKHPTYVVALLAATRVAGDVLGLHLLGVLGALGVAVAAWLVAGEVDRRASRGAFWIAASGPVAVNAFLMWAHAPSAALGGFATLAAVRLTRAVRARHLALLLACVVAGVLVRAEGLLFAIALALGLLVAGWKERSWTARAGVPGLCVAAAGGAAFLEQRWRSAVIGSAYPTQGFREGAALPVGSGGDSLGLVDWVEGRIDGAWHSLFQGSFNENLGIVLVAVALVFLAYAAWTARRLRPGWQRDVELALAVALALYVIRFVTGSNESMIGLFAAWPVVLLGLALFRRAGHRAEVVLPVTVAAFLLAVVATQYRGGGGFEWGGRFLSPSLVPMAVLACVGVRRSLLAERRPARQTLVLLSALAVVPTLAGLFLVGTARHRNGELIDEVTAGDPKLVVTNVVGLAPFGWRTYPDVGWMVAPPSEFGEIAARLEAGGVGEVTVMGPARLDPADLAPYTGVEDVTGPEARRRGLSILRLSSGENEG